MFYTHPAWKSSIWLHDLFGNRKIDVRPNQIQRQGTMGVRSSIPATRLPTDVK